MIRLLLGAEDRELRAFIERGIIERADPEDDVAAEAKCVQQVAQNSRVTALGLSGRVKPAGAPCDSSVRLPPHACRHGSDIAPS